MEKDKDDELDIFAGLEEEIDILDENGNNTGEHKTYDEVHGQGLLHLCVHVWFVNSIGQILLQKRSKYVRVYKECWDSSASGHVTSGQGSLGTMQKETREELGLDLPQEAFEYLFRVKEKYTVNNGAFIENAFNDIYLVHSDLAIEEFKFDKDEVKEIKWIDIEEFKKWTKGEGEIVVPHNEEYEKLFEYLITTKN